MTVTVGRDRFTRPRLLWTERDVSGPFDHPLVIGPGNVDRMVLAVITSTR